MKFKRVIIKYEKVDLISLEVKKNLKRQLVN